jgi:hypothetical protein
MRQLTPFAQKSETVKHLLEILIDRNTRENEYASSFYELGKILSSIIKQQHDITGSKIMLACSSEDADWLSKGILDNLSTIQSDIKLAVFWNLRVNPLENKEIAIAPIVKSYIEPILEADYLVICKSIISSSCVVRTNITLCSTYKYYLFDRKD